MSSFKVKAFQGQDFTFRNVQKRVKKGDEISPNLKSYTSKFKLDYPLSKESIFRVGQEFIRSKEANKRPKFLLDHPVGLGTKFQMVPTNQKFHWDMVNDQCYLLSLLEGVVI